MKIEDMVTFEVKPRYAWHIKPEPYKKCEYCGRQMHRERFSSGRVEDFGAFTRRKYCDRDCMRKAFVKQGKNTEQLYTPSHASARKIAYLICSKESVCDICGKVGKMDVHHIDGNRNNNTAENLIVICRSCHMKIHHPNGVVKNEDKRFSHL